jgi:hypothetical protein
VPPSNIRGIRKSLVCLLCLGALHATQGLAQTEHSLQSEPALQTARILAQDDRAVRVWWYGWFSVFAASGGIQTGLGALATDRGFVADRLVIATSSWLGVAGLGLSPLQPLPLWPALQDPADEARWLDLQLRERARQEQAIGGWLDHTLCAVVAVGAGAFLWLHEDRPTSAALTGGLNLIVGEIQLWTAPTVALDAWRRLHPGQEP